MLTRRIFLAGLGATLAAPAIVRAHVLMPVRSIFVPEPTLPCDGRVLRARDYPDLFAVLRHRYGGAGPTFRVPDMRGQFLAQTPPGRSQLAAISHSASWIIATGRGHSPAIGAGTVFPTAAPVIGRVDG